MEAKKTAEETTNWKVRFCTTDGKDDGECMFFIEGDLNKENHYPRVEIMQEDFGDHNGYTREMRLNDANKIVAASQSNTNILQELEGLKSDIKEIIPTLKSFLKTNAPTEYKTEEQKEIEEFISKFKTK